MTSSARPGLRLSLFDDLIGARQQCWRNRQSKRLSGAEIDHQFNRVGSFDRQISRLGPLQNLVHKDRCAAVVLHEIGAVAQQPAIDNGFTVEEDRWQASLLGQFRNAQAKSRERNVRWNKNRFHFLLCKLRESAFQIVGPTIVEAHQRNRRSGRGVLGLSPLRHMQGVINIDNRANARKVRELFTMPKVTGSAPLAMTIGIVLVALLTAILAGTGPETIRRGWRRTSSAARVGRRLREPSAYRYSNLMLTPST